MGLVFCGKRGAQAVLVLYKYCPYLCDFVGICFDLARMYYKPACWHTISWEKELTNSASYYKIPYRKAMTERSSMDYRFQ